MTDSTMTLAAEFTNGSKSRPARLALVWIDARSGSRHQIADVAVSGKREARNVAASHNATPWNF